MRQKFLPQINNAFYDDLGEKWYQDNSGPIAILRAESHLKFDYVKKVLSRAKLMPSVRILDIGCGGGLVTNPLARAGYEMTGIDASDASLKVAQSRAESPTNPRYIVGDAYHLPETLGSFDVVLMLDFLEHVDRPQDAIKEAARVLKPGGILVFHTFSRNRLSEFLVIKALSWIAQDYPEHMHVYQLFIQPEELRGMCHLSGIEVQDLVGSRPKYWSLAFVKSLIRRKMDPLFTFVYTGSLSVGYLGYGILKSSSPICKLKISV